MKRWTGLSLACATFALLGSVRVFAGDEGPKLYFGTVTVSQQNMGLIRDNYILRVYGDEYVDHASRKALLRMRPALQRMTSARADELIGMYRTPYRLFFDQSLFFARHNYDPYRGEDFYTVDELRQPVERDNERPSKLYRSASVYMTTVAVSTTKSDLTPEALVDLSLVVWGSDNKIILNEPLSLEDLEVLPHPSGHVHVSLNPGKASAFWDRIKHFGDPVGSLKVQLGFVSKIPQKSVVVDLSQKDFAEFTQMSLAAKARALSYKASRALRRTPDPRPNHRPQLVPQQCSLTFSTPQP